jgi:hypothetical protein
MDITEYKKKKRDHEIKTASALMFVKLAESGENFDNTTLVEHSNLFDKWVEGIGYIEGQIRIDESDGIIYRCLETHESAKAKNLPSKSPKIWGKIADPADGFPEWFPYIGVQDAWLKGDKCSHDGKNWVSTVDNNVWEPGVNGWEQVD